MSRKDRYLQFPLCLLLLSYSKKKLAQVILDYCIYKYGGDSNIPITSQEKINKRVNEAILSLSFDESTNSNKYNESMYSNNNNDSGEMEVIDEKKSYDYAYRLLKLKKNEHCPEYSNFLEAKEFIRSYECKYDRDVLVRISKKIFMSFYKGNLPERSFRLLAGLYSIIGNKEYCPATYDQLQHRMLGFKSSFVFEDVKENLDESKILSIRQIGTTMKKLEMQHFFISCRPNNRKKYYSIRLNYFQLRNKFVRKSSSWKAFNEQKKSVFK